MREKLIELLMETFPNASGDRGYYACCADELIANDVTVQRWIPVTEGVPDGECIAINSRKEIIIGYIVADAYSESGYLAESEYELMYDATHWMPLPEPTKDGGV